jgi:hypothetical protein
VRTFPKDVWFRGTKTCKSNKGAGVALYDSIATYDSGLLYDDTSSPQPNRRKMAKVRLGLRNLAPDQKIDQANTIKTAMTGNANFTTPNPPLATLTSQETLIRAKIATVETLKASLQTAVTDADAAAATGVNYLNQEAFVCANDERGSVKIQSSGFDVASDGGPVHMTQVLNLGAATGDSPGEVDLN